MPIGFMVRLATIGSIAEGRNKQGGRGRRVLIRVEVGKNLKTN